LHEEVNHCEGLKDQDQQEEAPEVFPTLDLIELPYMDLGFLIWKTTVNETMERLRTDIPMMMY